MEYALMRDFLVRMLVTGAFLPVLLRQAQSGERTAHAAGFAGEIQARRVAKAAAITGVPLSAANTRENAPQFTTLEHQVDYLVGALSEGICSMDVKMIHMSADGLLAMGSEGKDLEIAMLRAERDSAFAGCTSSQIVVMGQLARARAGDMRALPTIRSWAFAELPVNATVNSRSNDFALNLQRQCFAYIGLALMQEPGIAQKAIIALRKFTDGNLQLREADTDALALAALVFDPEGGVKELLTLYADEKAPVGAKAALIQKIASIAAGTASRQNTAAAFSLDGELGAKMPQDALAQAAIAYVSLLKHWKCDSTKPYEMRVIQAGNVFPPRTFDVESLQAIKGIRNRLPHNPESQYAKMYLDQLLMLQGINPVIPKDF
jgi:hypothetical protein